MLTNYEILMTMLFVVWFYISMEWKRKADLWDKKQKENYVPNYWELIERQKYDRFKERVDYIMLTLISFSSWIINRVAQRFKQVIFLRDKR